MNSTKSLQKVTHSLVEEEEKNVKIVLANLNYQLKIIITCNKASSTQSFWLSQTTTTWYKTAKKTSNWLCAQVATAA